MPFVLVMFCSCLSCPCQKPVGIPTRSIAHCLSLLPYSSVTCFVDCLPFHLVKVSHKLIKTCTHSVQQLICDSVYCSLFLAHAFVGSIPDVETSLSNLYILQEQVLSVYSNYMLSDQYKVMLKEAVKVCYGI